MHEVDRDAEYSILKAVVHFDGSKNQASLFFWYVPEHIPFKIVLNTTKFFSTHFFTSHAFFLPLNSHFEVKIH